MTTCTKIPITDFLQEMSPSDEGSASHLHRNDNIQHGHTLLFKLPNGEVRGIKVEKDSYVLYPISTGRGAVDPTQNRIAG